MMLVTHDPQTKVTLIQTAEQTAQQKIQALSDYLLNELRKADVRFCEDLVIRSGKVQIMKVRGVATDHLSRIWIMNAAGNWNEVKPRQIFADLILNCLEKRIKQTL